MSPSADLLEVWKRLAEPPAGMVIPVCVPHGQTGVQAVKLRERLGRLLFPAQWEVADKLDKIANDLNELTPRLEALLFPKPELTAGDIAKKHEQKVSGRKPWRVMQREAELASSPEIQRELKIEKEKKEISDAS